MPVVNHNPGGMANRGPMQGSTPAQGCEEPHFPQVPTAGWHYPAPKTSSGVAPLPLQQVLTPFAVWAP